MAHFKIDFHQTVQKFVALLGRFRIFKTLFFLVLISSIRFLSRPVAVCDNNRISRSRIYQCEAWGGKIASKHRYFSGIK